MLRSAMSDAETYKVFRVATAFPTPVLPGSGSKGFPIFIRNLSRSRSTPSEFRF
jgi:hypothetical protein